MLSAFWNIWLELSSWLLLGAIAGGILHVLLPAGWMQRHLTGRMGILKAVLLGIPLPLCSCGVIPVGLGLRKNGASNGAAVGFLISTPQTGVDSILISGTFLGWPFALLKVLVALVTGLVGGALAGTGDQTSAAVSSASSGLTNPSGVRPVIEHSLELIRSIWGWLVIGVVASAAITWLIPENELSRFGVMQGLPALLMTLVISLPLYVCATASVPIAAALVAGGLPPGAALVFLMAGPATNLATLGAVYRTLGRRSLAAYLTTIIAGSLIAGMLFNGLITPVTGSLHAHDHTAAWWQVTCAILLAAIVSWFAMADLMTWLRSTVVTEPLSGSDTRTLHVLGMTCDGCAGRLKSRFLAHPGIEAAEVSWQHERAVVKGSASGEEVTGVVNSAGFTVADD